MEKVVVKKELEIDRLRCLLLASFLLGQEAGLNGYLYDNKLAIKKRDALLSLMLEEIGIPPTTLTNDETEDGPDAFERQGL